MRRFISILFTLVLISSYFTISAPASADAADYDIPMGHFYTQAAGPGAGANTGFGIMDSGVDDRGQTIKFWSEFKRLGGVAALGYPASNRFLLDGFWTQATQRVLMQWRPELKAVVFVNVFDKLHDMGKDAALQAKYQIPAPVNVDDSGKPFSQVVAERQAYLNANPKIKSHYFSVSDPLQLNGLPTSQIADASGVFDIIRSQRVVIQYWKKSIPGVANAGDVTVGLGGDIAKEFGLVPGFAMIPLPSRDAMLMNLVNTVPVKGYVLFGDNFKRTDNGFEIEKPRTSFRAGEPVRYVAYLAESAGATKLTRIISFVLPDGTEKVVLTLDNNIDNPQATLLAGGINTKTDLMPGVYRFRDMRGSTLLAEGVFGIEAPAP